MAARARFVAVGICVLAAAALLVYALTRPPEALLPAGELRVGIDASYPPFGSIAPSGEVQGIDADVARALAARLGVSVRFVNLGFDGLYDALLTYRVDVLISALPVVPVRVEQVYYTRPYFNAGLLLVSDSTALLDRNALPGHSIAYEFGSLADEQVRRWARLLAPFDTQPYELADNALDAVRLGAADVALVDAVSARLYLQTHPDWQPHTAYSRDLPYVAVVAGQRPGLFRVLDEALARLLDDGTIDAILRRWL